MVIALLNLSTVTQPDVDLIVEACNSQLERDFERIYGLKHHPVEFFARREDVPPGSQVIVLFKNQNQATQEFDLPRDPHPMVADAAYGVGVPDAEGRSFGRVFVERIIGNGEGTVLDGPRSVSVSTSHEVLEGRAEPYINRWAVGPDLRVYAYEVCDAVDDQCYEVEVHDEHGKPRTVSVTDFVYPEWFNPKAVDVPFNHNHEREGQGVVGPFEFAPGGFRTVFDPRAEKVQTMIEPEKALPEWKVLSRGLPLARSRWHLVHGAPAAPRPPIPS